MGDLLDLEQMLAAEPVGVDRAIDPADEMYSGSEDHYFSVGRSALRAIRLALASAGASEVASVLDLPCGHGRVLRMLRAEFPAAQITACDLNREGVDFCAANFGAEPLYSDPQPERIPVQAGRYDLVWSGSLLTHLDARTFESFIVLFARTLRVGGVLVVTTHGARAADRMRSGVPYGLSERATRHLLRDYERSGFAYCDYPDRRGYGISLSSPQWVTRVLERRADLRLVSFVEGGWDDHQDVVACRKI
jgi:SAM-dependent methyltransferase